MSAQQPQTNKARAGEEVARKRLFRGTRLCKFFLAGCCSRGDACNFAHSADDLQNLPDFSKTRLCDPFMKSGVCEQGYDCKFAHSQDELRPSYISKSKPNRSPDRPKKETQAASDRQESAQRQSLPPATQAGLLHSAALYTLILQGLNPPGTSSTQAASTQAVQATSSAQAARPDSPVAAGRVLSASPRADKYSMPSWSRQTTADVDESLRAFSRQTTEEPQSSLFRQITDDSRRPLPLSQLLSLPEPDEPSDSQEASVDATHETIESQEVNDDGSDGDEELQVTLKNTFLHWEPVQGPSHLVSLRRSRSLPISLPEDARNSVDVRN